MRPATPSHTAQRVAAHRARHQLVDDPRVFEDPLAVAILGADGADALRREPATGDDISSRALRAFVTVRSRLAEDTLAEAFARGVRQYLVLGAGLDTFAYRNPHDGLQVTEVDHPATQAWKREALQHAGIVVPASMRFVPVDFDHESLTSALVQAGFDFTQPAYVSWLGVTPYLEPAATMATLRELAKLPHPSGVTFDYALPADMVSAHERARLDALAARVAAAGEPFRGFHRPDALARDLTAVGFVHLEDLNRDALNARYFQGRTDGLRVRGAAHLLSAWT